MLTQIQCLSEIGTSIPDNPRRFHVENELMGIDPSKVIMARTLTGKILVPVEDKDFETEVEQKLIEVYFDGGIYTTTMLTDELKGLLFKKVEANAQTAKKPHKQPPTLQPYDAPVQIGHSGAPWKTGDKDSWD